VWGTLGSGTYKETDMTIIFDDSEGVARYRAIVIAKALKLYSDTGFKANRAYTPRRMMNAATEITGQKFKPRQYMDAHDALMAMVNSGKRN
jgi:hypothetical protein